MIRVALIGLGAAARHIHLPACRQVSGRVTVVGGCDPDPGARSQAGVPLATEAPEELLERTEPHLVVVGTPPALHREHTELALAAGCHVLCEKPLAPTLADTDAIVAASRRAGRLVIVNSEFPFMRIHAAAQSTIGMPEFGRLLHVHAWHTMAPTAETEAGWRGGLSRRLGLEFGIHVFDLIRFFFDDMPTRVIAHMPRPDQAIGWDPVNVVALEFADGRGASMMLDRLSRGPERYLDIRLDGERGAIHTSLGGQLRIAAGLHTRERRPFLEWRMAGGGRAVLQRGSQSRVLATDGLNPFASATARLLTAVADAVERRGPVPRGTAEDHRVSLGLVFAAYESAEQGRAIAVPPAPRRPPA